MATPWQRRGYASLTGLATVIAMDTNQCVDFEVLSKVCKTCEVLEKKNGAHENKMQNYFGIAIRTYNKDILQM